MVELKWSDELRNWLVNCKPKDRREILKVYSRSTLGGLYSGRQNFESIPYGKKIRLYDITKIEAFNVIGENEHPNSLDMSRIRQGLQPRSLIKAHLEYEGIIFSKVAKNIGVHQSTFSEYLSNSHVFPNTTRKIEEGLAKFFSQNYSVSPETQSQAIPAKTTPPQKKSENPYNSIISEIKELRVAVEKVQIEIAKTFSPETAAEYIERNFLPSLEQRISAVNFAIEILANEANYFRMADEAERKALASSIDPDLWGYVATIIPRIDQKESWETIARLMPRPERRKK